MGYKKCVPPMGSTHFMENSDNQRVVFYGGAAVLAIVDVAALYQG
jgi:hypothetical protein